MPILPTYSIDHIKKTLSIEDESGLFGQHFMRAIYTIKGYEVKIIDSLNPSKLEIAIE